MYQYHHLCLLFDDFATAMLHLAIGVIDGHAGRKCRSHVMREEFGELML